MTSIEVVIEEIAPGVGIWHARRGRKYLGTVARRSDHSYVAVSNGKERGTSSSLEAAKEILREALESGDDALYHFSEDARNGSGTI